jgi:hypothetical protein
VRAERSKASFSMFSIPAALPQQLKTITIADWRKSDLPPSALFPETWITKPTMHGRANLTLSKERVSDWGHKTIWNTHSWSFQKDERQTGKSTVHLLVPGHTARFTQLLKACGPHLSHFVKRKPPARAGIWTTHPHLLERRCRKCLQVKLRRVGGALRKGPVHHRGKSVFGI